MSMQHIDFTQAALYLDLQAGITDVNHPSRSLELHGTRRIGDGLLFTDALQWAQVDAAAMQQIARGLHGISSITIGGWIYSYRHGEGYFLSRGLPQVLDQGFATYPPRDGYVCFCIGMDRRGFMQGVANGNGLWMTLNTVAPSSWHQLIICKEENGHQSFYLDGELVYADHNSCWSPDVRTFEERSPHEAEPIRLMMPAGGVIGEAWILPYSLSAEEVLADYRAKSKRYQPATPARRAVLREMDVHPVPGLWHRGLSPERWPQERRRILRGVRRILGKFPGEKVPLEPAVLGEEDCGSYWRRKVSFQVQPGERMPAYLLIPKELKAPAPAVICIYGTTQGAGKDAVVGISGPAPGLPPMKNRNFALDMVRAGFVTFAGDYLRDGERLLPGQKPYDSTAFYKQFPEWSIVGKDAWDSSCAVDYLQSLSIVDPERIGMVGHSYGGHNAIFAAALDTRINAIVANGPVSNFRSGDHWAPPPGSSGNEYIRALRPYVVDHSLRLPVTFYEFTALLAPRPLLVGQAVSEPRPHEEENYAAVREVYKALSCSDRVYHHWYAGDHDFPPEARYAAVEWFKQWLKERTP